MPPLNRTIAKFPVCCMEVVLNHEMLLQSRSTTCDKVQKTSSTFNQPIIIAGSKIREAHNGLKDHFAFKFYLFRINMTLHNEQRVQKRFQIRSKFLAIRQLCEGTRKPADRNFKSLNSSPMLRRNAEFSK